VAGSIDEYQIFDEFGNPLARLYLSPHHKKTSIKPPRGFHFSNG